jgi:hypothetical protein
MMESNLMKRVRKSEALTFVDVPGSKVTKGATWGSKGGNYNVSLVQKKELEKIASADGRVFNARLIGVCCEVLVIDNGKLNPMEPCPGNCRHTVCYHSLGYIMAKLNERGQEIKYCDSLAEAISAIQSSSGWQLVKIASKQGEGFVWATVRNKPVTSKILDVETNRRLMRGDENDEGID